MLQTHLAALGLALSLMACQAARPSAAGSGLAWGSPRRFEELHLLSEQLQPAPGGYLVSPVLEPTQAFDQVLASWNAEEPVAGAFRVELRVGDTQGWSPWLWLADWGPSSLGPAGHARESERGRVEVDAFVASRPLERVQLRFCGWNGSSQPEAPHVSRLDLCLRQARLVGPAPRSEAPLASAPLPVPRLSQCEAAPALSARICSPTSLAMVLAYHGQANSPEAVAARAFDPWHDIYGNWPRSIQGAWSFGVPGYLTCFSRWSHLEKMVSFGRPVIISIRVEPGALAGAPYASTPGHLLVVVGFDGRGGVIVNDPAAPTQAGVRRVYERAELGRAWFGHGGVAYVLAPLQKPG